MFFAGAVPFVNTTFFVGVLFLTGEVLSVGVVVSSVDAVP